MKVNAGLDVERNEWIEVGHQAKNWEGRKSRSTTDKKKKGGLGRKERKGKEDGEECPSHVGLIFILGVGGTQMTLGIFHRYQ